MKDLKVKSMGSTSIRIKLDIETLSDEEIMISFADENWGPVVTGKTREEAEAKFIEALRIVCVSESIKSITRIEEHKDYKEAKELKERLTNPKIIDSELLFEQPA